ncbi:DNA/RNA helicase domain-containing protein [Deinococcus malanensis]|uniref:DNA/RNA helicase domain-containing protein n=1 Tax=Deinococcus malanensis TaxID=1706855 RepID=UPI001664C881|nr:DNA/RNA helicase domain-containing protein [Deinococcus malanensis]
MDTLAMEQPELRQWTIAFEYELPRERGRRPDVVLLTHDRVLVLEFKDHPRPSRVEQTAHIDQVAAYARDLQHYHAASHHLAVLPVLVYAHRPGLQEERGEVIVLGPDRLKSHLTSFVAASSPQFDHMAWLNADYAPLPTLVSAARRLFEHEPLPAIRRAQSAGIEQTVAALIDAARTAHEQGEHHLALVTGVPGAGKTLVGLQFVYARTVKEGEGERDAVFLSGNGPLVSVLQHALENKVFVQGVHDFLKQYGAHRDRLPEEHIWVYDEAQRAWDAQQVLEKRGHATSEPEDFLRLGAQMTGWAMLVGLIGEGQEIYIGEEGGLAGWNTALQNSEKPWTLHAPEKITHLFSHATSVIPNNALDLTVSLRSHLAEDLYLWVHALLAGEDERARHLITRIQAQGFEVYLTRDLEIAKEYVRTRYKGAEDKRYGLLASSKASNLKQVGLDAWNLGVKAYNAGPWFNNPPLDPKSCCQLTRLASEFVCQGLELDFPIVCWGTDLKWTGQDWQSPTPRTPAAGKRVPENPHRLRVNSYRVLLTRGRDGMILYVPAQTALDQTYSYLQALDLPELPSRSEIWQDRVLETT